MAHPLAYVVGVAVAVVAAVFLVIRSNNENQQHSHHSRRDRSRRNPEDHYPPPRSWYDDDDDDDDDDKNKRQGLRTRKQDTAGRQQRHSSPHCAICMESFHQLVNGGRNLCSLPCGHIFCEKCIKASLQHTSSCPKCRCQATAGDLKYAYL